MPLALEIGPGSCKRYLCPFPAKLNSLERHSRIAQRPYGILRPKTQSRASSSPKLATGPWKMKHPSSCFRFFVWCTNPTIPEPEKEDEKPPGLSHCLHLYCNAHAKEQSRPRFISRGSFLLVRPRNERESKPLSEWLTFTAQAISISTTTINHPGSRSTNKSR